MGFTIKKSSSWAIGAGISAGLVPVAGLTVIGITLFDVENQAYYSGTLAGSSVGGGLKAGGAVSTFSPTFFTVPPMLADDFHNKLCAVLDASFTVLIGGSLTGLSIYGVNHSPSVLDLGGLNAGVSVGITLSPLMYLSVDYDHPRYNSGCLVTPGGDPLCGGASRPGAVMSKDENMSRSP